MLSQFILLPLYIYPAGNAWQKLYKQAAAYPNLDFTVVIDPADGPGSGACPDTNWITAIDTLNTLPNARLLAYVHTLQATRPLNDVYADIDKYASWKTKCKTGSQQGKTYDLHLDGVFFDESPAVCDSSTCPYMRKATARVTSKLGAGSDYKVFNAGVHSNVVIDAALYSLADTIIVFEDYYSAYSQDKVTAIPSAVRGKSAFIIHDFNGSTKDQAKVVDQLVGGGILGVHMTTESDYDVWDKKWTSFTKYMNAATPNSNANTASALGDSSSVGVAGT